MSELKPCPFCGNEAFQHRRRRAGMEYENEVHCAYCTAMAESPEEWNTRADRECECYNRAKFGYILRDLWAEHDMTNCPWCGGRVKVDE